MILVSAASATSRLSHGKTLKPPSMTHKEWMAKHGRVYKDAAEEEYRSKIFKQTVEHIESSNRNGNLKYKLGLNKFSDLTNEEFRERYMGNLLEPLDAPTIATSFKYENLTDAPSAMDWRGQAVTEVKNQNPCGI